MDWPIGEEVLVADHDAHREPVDTAPGPDGPGIRAVVDAGTVGSNRKALVGTNPKRADLTGGAIGRLQTGTVAVAVDPGVGHARVGGNSGGLATATDEKRQEGQRPTMRAYPVEHGAV